MSKLKIFYIDGDHRFSFDGRSLSPPQRHSLRRTRRLDGYVGGNPNDQSLSQVEVLLALRKCRVRGSGFLGGPERSTLMHVFVGEEGLWRYSSHQEEMAVDLVQCIFRIVVFIFYMFAYSLRRQWPWASTRHEPTCLESIKSSTPHRRHHHLHRRRHHPHRRRHPLRALSLWS